MFRRRPLISFLLAGALALLVIVVLAVSAVARQSSEDPRTYSVVIAASTRDERGLSVET